MKYVYPAIFTPLNEGHYDVYIPDLPYCRTCGNNLAEAIEMAEDAASMWLWDAENNKEAIPNASNALQHDPPQFVSMILADTNAWRSANDNSENKETVPQWIHHEAETSRESQRM